MKKLLLFVSLTGLLLGACSTPQHLAVDYPEEFGLFVATTNIFTSSDLYVQMDGADPVAIKVRHVGDNVGYAMASLPPGRYRLMMYSPDGRTNYPITTENGWFEIQANCFNYGGDYQFTTGEDGMPRYTNKTTIADIQNMPGHYKDLAENKDICDAGMGRPSERLKAEDVTKVMPDL
ncbi:MAG TPA: hypothetical protein VGM16_01375 [Gammaproteobacteria bacterium]|jgi:hypothetical protein